MSITFIGTATITFTGYGTGGGPPTAACDYTTPTGAETGDLLLAFINIFDNLGCVITPPLGWALVPNSRIDHPNGGDDDLTSAAYYWVASGTPAATYAFTIAPPSPTEFDIAGACARGVSSIDAASTNGGFEGTVEATAFDTAENNETLIGFYSIDEVADCHGTRRLHDAAAEHGLPGRLPVVRALRDASTDEWLDGDPIRDA